MAKQLFAGLATLAVASAAMGQSVTVGTTGANHTSLTAAVAAVKADPAAPNVITFIDAGPFFENDRIALDEFATGPDDMIIQGAPGVRPVIIADIEAATRKSGMIYLRKQGNLTVKDLIVLPPVAGVTPENYTAKVAETGIEIQVDNLLGTSITLENIFIGSNNGSNQPTGALDGLTPPVTTAGTVSFRDEGILVQSQTGGNQLHYLNMTGVVVSGVDGDQGSDAIRGFPDGSVGSEWILGPGTVLSYNGGHGFQPGGTTNFSVQVRGEEGNPVKIINNERSGINVTNQAGAASGLTNVEWCIIANQLENGTLMGDLDTSSLFTNVTIANNGGVALLGPADPNAVTYTFSNVIAAGDGGAADADNVIRLIKSGTGTAAPSFFTATNSAIVLAGPYTLNSTAYGADGIDSDGNYTVTTTGVVNSDPEFITLNPAAGGFAVVSNQAYGTAGPAGQPLVGGGAFAAASVEDWQLF